MGYNDVIDRSNPGGGALVPPEVSRAIFKEAATFSAALGLMRRMPILTNAKSFPVLNQLPLSFWLDPSASPQNDMALIQTSEMAWKNVTMNVAELGVIIPFPRRLAEDMKAGGFNLTEEVKPELAAAIGRKIDAAVFFGVDKPVVWNSDIVSAATAAGNVRTQSSTASQGGLHSDFIKLMKLVRADGFTANAGVGRATFEFDLLDARDTTGQPLYKPYDPLLSTRASVLGRPVQFATDGVFPAESLDGENINLIMFDPTKHIIGVREELFITVHTEGAITDADGKVVYNLMQQDMVAIRALMRVGYAAANPVTAAQSTEGNRYPAGVLKSVPADPDPETE